MIKFQIYDKKEKRYLVDDENNQYVMDMDGNLYNTNPRWNCETDLYGCRLELLDKKRNIVKIIK